MFAKLVGVGVASLVTVSLMGVRMTMRWDAQRVGPPDRATSTLARTLTQGARRPLDESSGDWAVTKAITAHNMLVVEVEARRLEDARIIATQIIEPVRARGYEEILIYVRQPGRKEPAVRRVQWTPHGGYAETSYADR